MNAFSKDYVSLIDWSDVVKDRKQSARATANREAGMRSDDKHKRMAASGYQGPLSNNSDPAKKGRILKSSKVG